MTSSAADGTIGAVGGLNGVDANIQKGTNTMLATANVENVTLSLPDADLAMLRMISRKMGWKLKTRRKSGLEKALEDVAAGRVYEAKSFEDLLEQLEIA